jgi:hypothetical protein
MRAAAAASVLVLLAGTTACGGDDSSSEDYCAALAEEKVALQRLSARADEPGSDALTRSVEVFERLRDAAPAELGDEWTTYVNAWHGLTDALDSAGADASVFRNGKRPDGVDPEAYDAIQDAAGKLTSPPVRDASAGIEQHATDVCDVDLGGAVG